MAPLTVRAWAEGWPIAGSFVIARGARTEAVVVVAEVSDGEHRGRGECVPYPRYGETAEGVVAAIQAAPLPADGDREALRRAMPAGAARNALDCALWDWQTKATGVPVWRRAGRPALRPVETAYTVSLGEPAAMAEAARRAADRPLLKLKLGGAGDPARLEAIRKALPHVRLIADANEAWSPADFAANMRACAEAGVELVEQPLPAGGDDFLLEAPREVPICADESLHGPADLDRLAGRYDAVNIKLDKTGGLTEALDLLAAAKARDLRVMVGCMVGTSLAMAPALLLAQEADFVDLDGPLLLAQDRVPGLTYAGAMVHPPPPELWG